MRNTDVADLMQALWGDSVPREPIDWPTLIEDVLEIDDQLGHDAGRVVLADDLQVVVLAKLLDQMPQGDEVRRLLPPALVARVEAERGEWAQRCWLDATTAILERAIAEHGVNSASVYLLDGDICRLSAYTHWRSDLLKYWRWAPLKLDLPMMEAIRGARPVWDRYVPSDNPADGDEILDLLALPIVVGAGPEPIGALVLTWQPTQQAPADSKEIEATSLAGQIGEQFALWSPRPGLTPDLKGRPPTFGWLSPDRAGEPRPLHRPLG